MYLRAGVFSLGLLLLSRVFGLLRESAQAAAFGSTGMGPSDEALQMQNAKNVISQSGIDIWALGEISDATAWQNLQNALPDYEGAISGWSQVQKTALLYKKSICSKIYQRHVLAGHESDFAGGRLPLEVALQTRMLLDV